ncbi:MAG: UDP-N-acetylmuramoyl-L-alanyl-D-glutamate--2,6-diaminopimelate ligase [Lautropia sp.]|nr:UDP-N-acetylmuramoyl-L-alanyl-D-glutamate--2,6-diaminopimelate ligase [Lautropia sp.]
MTRHEAGQAPVLIAPDQLSDWLHRHLPQTGRLTADSRRVRSGDAFFALRGARHDGTAYIQQALDAGASAIVLEAGEAGPSSCAAEHLPVPVCQVPSLKAHLGTVAADYYGRPTEALSLVAVTGTNGKTSVTHWVADGCNQVMADDKAVVVGTNGAGVPGALQPIGMTTPDGLTIQDLFRHQVDEGVQVAAIEASSIGLEQGRLAGSAIQIAVFTNLSRDHLDYHGSMQAYAEAKRALFAWPGLEAAVINLDDAMAPALLETVSAHPAEPYCVGYLIHDATQTVPAEAIDPDSGMPATLVEALDRADACDEVLMAVSFTPGQWVLTLMSAAGDVVVMDDADAGASSGVGQSSVDLHLQVLGRFNLANALAVAGVWRSMGWSLSDIAEQLARLRPVPGRMENIGVPGGTSAAELALLPLVVVDYAHTPDALENTLGALREVAQQRGGRLWCVFGAGGDRDPGKRPQMATVAERLADVVVLTSDNPRSEDPRQILVDIQAGLTRLPWLVQENRAEAIDAAVQAAAAQDVVLVAGKGREATQEVAGVFHPFSDPGVVGEALLRRLNRAILPGDVDV